MKGFKDENGKFHPIKNYKGVRKSRDPKEKTQGIKIRKLRGYDAWVTSAPPDPEIEIFEEVIWANQDKTAQEIANLRPSDLEGDRFGDVYPLKSIEKQLKQDREMKAYEDAQYKQYLEEKASGYDREKARKEHLGIRKKLDDDSFVVLWDVASRSGRGKYDPLWRTGGKADWIEPKKVYKLIQELEEQGMVKLRPTGDPMDYPKGHPQPTYRAEITPKGLEYFNQQKEMGRTENLPLHNPLIKYEEQYSYMSPEERLENMQEIMSKGLANKYNLKMSADALVKMKIMTRSGKVLDRKRALEWFS